MLAVSTIMVLAFASVVIMVGSISFFSSRGSQISYVILQVILNLSLFPVGRALKGRERWILYFTPLIITATLPRWVIMDGTFLTFLAFTAITAVFLYIGVCFFNFGLKYFKSKNYIFLNE